MVETSAHSSLIPTPLPTPNVAGAIPPAQNERKSNAATGVSAAGARAFGSQMMAFYFRAPAKAFFRTRVDYLVYDLIILSGLLLNQIKAFAPAINPRVQANEGWSLRMSTPGLLSHAVRKYGWTFIPNHVLPPMLANIGVGAVLYTSYLQILGALHEPSSQSSNKVYPPPPVNSTLFAGFSAGAIQSVVAAPLDALSVRFKTSEVLEGRYTTMWHYGRSKLNEIGPRGVFAGWGLSFVKDSLGYAAFFAAFEYVKAQAYYEFVTIYYGNLQDHLLSPLLKPKLEETGPVQMIKPHFAVEPIFLTLAGLSASIAQQIIQHPLNLIQNIHFRSLSHLDREAQVKQGKAAMIRTYYAAYRKTYQQCLVHARRAGGWRKWLYHRFIWNTLKQTPSTSLGLIIFEIVRRRYGNETDAVKIEKDGYDILLT